MQQQLVNQSVDGLKSLGNVAIESIKLLAALLHVLAKKLEQCETKEDATKCVEDFNKKADELLKGKMPAGEFSKEVKDAAVMDVPDSVVADMFETELLTKGFDYSRISEDSFAVRGGDMTVLNQLMKETATRLNGCQTLSPEQIATHAENELKFAKKGLNKNQIEKKMVKLQNKKSVKDVVKNFKEKSEKKNHDRERTKTKTKDKNAER